MNRLLIISLFLFMGMECVGQAPTFVERYGDIHKGEIPVAMEGLGSGGDECIILARKEHRFLVEPYGENNIYLLHAHIEGEVYWEIELDQEGDQMPIALANKEDSLFYAMYKYETDEGDYDFGLLAFDKNGEILTDTKELFLEWTDVSLVKYDLVSDNLIFAGSKEGDILDQTNVVVRVVDMEMNLLWEEDYSVGEIGEPKAMIVDSSRNIIIAGTAAQNMAGKDSAGFLLKVDSLGVEQWQIATVGDTASAPINFPTSSLVLSDNSEQYHIAGRIADPIEANHNRFFIVTYTIDGEKEWEDSWIRYCVEPGEDHNLPDYGNKIELKKAGDSEISVLYTEYSYSGIGIEEGYYGFEIVNFAKYFPYYKFNSRNYFLSSENFFDEIEVEIGSINAIQDVYETQSYDYAFVGAKLQVQYLSPNRRRFYPLIVIGETRTWGSNALNSYEELSAPDEMEYADMVNKVDTLSFGNYLLFGHSNSHTFPNYYLTLRWVNEAGQDLIYKTYEYEGFTTYARGLVTNNASEIVLTYDKYTTEGEYVDRYMMKLSPTGVKIWEAPLGVGFSDATNPLYFSGKGADVLLYDAVQGGYLYLDNAENTSIIGFVSETGVQGDNIMSFNHEIQDMTWHGNETLLLAGRKHIEGVSNAGALDQYVSKVSIYEEEIWTTPVVTPCIDASICDKNKVALTVSNDGGFAVMIVDFEASEVIVTEFDVFGNAEASGVRFGSYIKTETEQATISITQLTNGKYKAILGREDGSSYIYSSQDYYNDTTFWLFPSEDNKDYYNCLQSQLTDILATADGGYIAVSNCDSGISWQQLATKRDEEGFVLEISDIDSPYLPIVLEAYPNPNQGAFSLNLINGELGAMNLVVYDLQGREVHREELRKTSEFQTFQIQLPEYANGMMMCVVSDGINQYTTKILVE